MGTYVIDFAMALSFIVAGILIIIIMYQQSIKVCALCCGWACCTCCLSKYVRGMFLVSIHVVHKLLIIVRTWILQASIFVQTVNESVYMNFAFEHVVQSANESVYIECYRRACCTNCQWKCVHGIIQTSMLYKRSMKVCAWNESVWRQASMLCTLNDAGKHVGQTVNKSVYT